MEKLLVSSSPHYRAKSSVRRIMLDVIIAMLPIVVASVILFGWRALAITVLSVACCAVFESLFDWVTKKPNTVSDLSCIVTGMLFAFNVPVSVPYWLVVVGTFIAIVIAKMLFGGLGKNFANPALVGRAAVMVAWPQLMTFWIEPFSDGVSVLGGVDAVSSATPLSVLKSSGTLPQGLRVLDLFLGKTGGCLGEVCTAAILVGAVYLLIRRVISWRVPVAYLGTVAIITFLFPLNGPSFDVQYMLAQLCSGGLMLGAFFMATDYTTCPVTRKGMLIYGVGCGLLTVLFRYFSGYSEGVSYAILLMNVFTFAIDRATAPRRFGEKEGRQLEKEQSNQ